MTGEGLDPEEALQGAVSLLVTVVEACGAVVIIVGALWAFVRFTRVGLRRRSRRCGRGGSQRGRVRAGAATVAAGTGGRGGHLAEDLGRSRILR